MTQPVYSFKSEHPNCSCSVRFRIRIKALPIRATLTTAAKFALINSIRYIQSFTHTNHHAVNHEQIKTVKITEDRFNCLRVVTKLEDADDMNECFP